MNEPLKIGTLVQCKGGTPNPLHRKFAGTVHTIKRLSERDFNGNFGYFLEPPTLVSDFEDGAIELGWTREWLRVIDNPGESETDETLTWLPVPTTDEVPA